jgi:hypothetical protein
MKAKFSDISVALALKTLVYAADKARLKFARHHDVLLVDNSFP